MSSGDDDKKEKENEKITSYHVPVAQLDRATAF